MNIKIFGINLRISFLFVALMTLMLFFDRTGLIIPTVIAVFFHETAHLTAMKILHCAPSEIELIPGSIRIVNPQSYDLKKENIILISGPLCNIILFTLFYITYCFVPSEFILKSAAVQLVTAIFNLLPARGLDGGTLLYNFLTAKLSVMYANLTFIIFSLIIGMTFMALGLFCIINGNINPSFIILGLYIIVFTFAKI